VVMRGKHAAVRAASLPELRKAVSAAGHHPGPRRSALTRRHRRRP
jgi:hypothetical protein